MMSDCIIWHKSLRAAGYGQTFFQGKVMKAHRAAWIKVNGPIPKGMILDHMCHNEAAAKGECTEGGVCIHRACVNVEHLRMVTQRENILGGLQSIDVKTHCNQGHPFIKENIMVRKNGKRECAECNRVRARAVWARKKATV